MPLPFDPVQLKSVVDGLLDEHLAGLAAEGAPPEMCNSIRSDAHLLVGVICAGGETTFLAYGIVGLATQQLLDNNV